MDESRSAETELNNEIPVPPSSSSSPPLESETETETNTETEPEQQDSLVQRIEESPLDPIDDDATTRDGIVRSEFDEDKHVSLASPSPDRTDLDEESAEPMEMEKEPDSDPPMEDAEDEGSNRVEVQVEDGELEEAKEANEDETEESSPRPLLPLLPPLCRDDEDEEENRRENESRREDGVVEGECRNEEMLSVARSGIESLQSETIEMSEKDIEEREHDLLDLMEDKILDGIDPNMFDEQPLESQYDGYRSEEENERDELADRFVSNSVASPLQTDDFWYDLDQYAQAEKELLLGVSSIALTNDSPSPAPMLAPFVQDFSNDKLNGFRQDDALLPGRLSGLEKDSIQVNVSNVPSLESNLVSDEEKSSSSEHVSPSAPLNLSSNSTAEQEVQVLAVAEHDERDEEKNDEDEDAFSHSRRSIVHSHLDLQSPFGVRIEARFCCPHIGNRLTFLDEFVQHKILPIVSQLSSLKGSSDVHCVAARRATSQSRELLEDARSITRCFVHASESDSVLFTGSNAFDALSRVVDFLHLRGSPNMVPSLPIQSLPVVFVNSLETLEAWSAKDSSILAEIVLISGTQQTCIDEGKLIERLRQFSDRPLRIGCFSASSSSTGCGCDVGYVTHLLHSHDALAVWDFSTCAPYRQLNMNVVAVLEDGSQVEESIDALVLEPQKIEGGADSSAVLVLRQQLVQQRSSRGLGSDIGDFARYVENLELLERIEPSDLIPAVRAGLAIQFREALPQEQIDEKMIHLNHLAYRKLSQCESIYILNADLWETEDLITAYQAEPFLAPAVQFAVLAPVAGTGPRGSTATFVHPTLISRLLLDLFGVHISIHSVDPFTSPFANITLGGGGTRGQQGSGKQSTNKKKQEATSSSQKATIDAIRSHEHEYSRRSWLSILFDFHDTPRTVDRICKAIQFVAENAVEFMRVYAFDPSGGDWHILRPQLEDPNTSDMKLSTVAAIRSIFESHQNVSLSSIKYDKGKFCLQHALPPVLRQKKPPTSLSSPTQRSSLQPSSPNPPPHSSPSRPDSIESVSQRSPFPTYFESAKRIVKLLEAWGSCVDLNDELLAAEAIATSSPGRWFVVGADFGFRPKAPKKAAQSSHRSAIPSSSTAFPKKEEAVRRGPRRAPSEPISGPQRGSPIAARGGPAHRGRR